MSYRRGGWGKGVPEALLHANKVDLYLRDARRFFKMASWIASRPVA